MGICCVLALSFATACTLQYQGRHRYCNRDASIPCHASARPTLEGGEERASRESRAKSSQPASFPVRPHSRARHRPVKGPKSTSSLQARRDENVDPCATRGCLRLHPHHLIILIRHRRPVTPTMATITRRRQPRLHPLPSRSSSPSGQGQKMLRLPLQPTCLR